MSTPVAFALKWWYSIWLLPGKEGATCVLGLGTYLCTYIEVCMLHSRAILKWFESSCYGYSYKNSLAHANLESTHLVM